MQRKTKRRTTAVAVTGVAAVAALALLFGSGTLGFGGEAGADGATGESAKEQAAVTETVAITEPTQSTIPAAESQAATIDIRIQGREYNYQNVTYGNSEHPTDELVAKLKEFPPDTRIDLIVEDNATKNAVDELERLLTEAGFQDVHR